MTTGAIEVSSLMGLVDSNELNNLEASIKNDCNEFNSLSIGDKLRTANLLYRENRIIKELGELAANTIDRLDSELEVKNNTIIVLEEELKGINQYDEQKVNALLNKKPTILCVNRERVKRQLLETLKRTQKLNSKISKQLR